MDEKRQRRGKRYPVSIRVRWTRREREVIRQRAAEARRSISRYLVELGTLEDGAPLAAPVTPEQVERLEVLAFQMRKVGVNLNQLAHRENAAEYGTADPPSEEEIIAAAREVQDVCARIMAVLTESP